jgi:pilus assembly protein CpaF
VGLSFQSVFDSAEAVNGADAVAPKELIEPIHINELMDESNTLPRETLEPIGEVARFIQSAVQEQKRAASIADVSGEQETLDDRIVHAREAGPASDIWRAVARELDDLVIRWQKASTRRLNGPQLRWVRARTQDRFLGYDAIEPLRRNPAVTEIIIQSAAPQRVRVPGVGERWDRGTRIEMGGGLVSVPGVMFTSDEDVHNLVSDRMGAAISVERPRYSGSLTDGSRIEVKHRIITNTRDTFLALRRHPKSAWTLDALVANGTVTEELALDMASWSRGRLNLLIAGSTGSGKSTISNALLGCVNPELHVLILEDTAELNSPPFIFASFGITRPTSGTGDNVDLRAHIRSALRSRPDILIVGESRGGELVDVLTAMSTGHPGSMTTLHSDSGPDTIVRMRRMLAESGEISRDDIPQLISTSVDLLIFQGRMADGRRRVLGVWEIIKPDDSSVEAVERVNLRQLYTYDAENDRQVKLGEVAEYTLARRGLPELPTFKKTDLEEIAACSRRN